MAREYLVVKGSYHYLVDMDSNMGYSFTEFGQSIEPVNARYAVTLDGSVTEVDLLSILGDVTLPDCELYLNGSREVVKGSSMNLYAKLSKALQRASITPYRVVRKDMPGLVQILIPLRKGSSSLSDVLRVLKA